MNLSQFATRVNPSLSWLWFRGFWQSRIWILAEVFCESDEWISSRYKQDSSAVRYQSIELWASLRAVILGEILTEAATEYFFISYALHLNFACLPLWWNCPRTVRQFRSGNTLIFSVCNSDPASRCLHCSPLFVVCRRSHRLRASVWGTAGGDHLPRGVARGKNHHELQGPGQSTCHIHVTYAPHKPSVFTTRCVLCLPSFHISPSIISALPVLTLMHLPGLHYMYEIIRAVIGCEISILKGFPHLFCCQPACIYNSFCIRCLFFLNANKN